MLEYAIDDLIGYSILRSGLGQFGASNLNIFISACVLLMFRAFDSLVNSLTFLRACMCSADELVIVAASTNYVFFYL